MARWVWSAIAVLALLTAASANSPEPSAETLAALAKTCTADGAFGYRFGQKDAVLLGWAGIPPFAVETLSNGRDGLFEIVAAAAFARAPMSGEDRIALAGWVFKKLDTAIAARNFLRRQERRDGVAYIAAGFVLDLSRDGTTVRVSCTDIERKQRARQGAREDH